VKGRKTLLLIKRKDARRCRLKSPSAIGGSSHDLKNPLKNLRQCDCSTFIRIIATIVQGFFIFYDDPRPKLIPDRSLTLRLSHKEIVIALGSCVNMVCYTLLH